MKPTILVVEDHHAVRASLRNWLSAALPDCELMETTTGEDAVALIRTHPPDIVLMDIGLPRMNGIEATRWIKAIAPQVHVIVLTVYEAPEYKADAMAAGASAYIPKRRMYTDLIPMVTRLLSHLADTPHCDKHHNHHPPLNGE